LNRVTRVALPPRFVALVAVVLATFAWSGGAWAQQHKDGEVLVKVRAGASQSEQAQIDVDADADFNERVGTVDGGVIHRIHSRSRSTDQLLRDLGRNRAVVYAEPNYIVHADTVPNDPQFPNLWGLRNTGQVIGGVAGTPGADIKAEPAWTVTTGNRTVVVGVVDTGIDYNHPDLAANVWSNPGGIGGCAAGTHGYNAITKSCTPLDDNDHGSHCSGTIGGVGNNAVGVAGVNWTTSIMGLKFLDASGSGSTAGAIAAIDFAVNAKIAGVNVRVLSNSWGGGGFSQALLDEINKANANDILFVAAAGNNGTNNDTTPHYPSSYNAPNMVAVAATDNQDGLASFSNFGATSVHLGAPGVNVLSTTRNNTYSYFSGTSMATPHVHGVQERQRPQEHAPEQRRSHPQPLRHDHRRRTAQRLQGHPRLRRAASAARLLARGVALFRHRERGHLRELHRRHHAHGRVHGRRLLHDLRPARRSHWDLQPEPFDRSFVGPDRRHQHHDPDGFLRLHGVGRERHPDAHRDGYPGGPARGCGQLHALDQSRLGHGAEHGRNRHLRGDDHEDGLHGRGDLLAEPAARGDDRQLQPQQHDRQLLHPHPDGRSKHGRGDVSLHGHGDERNAVTHHERHHGQEPRIRLSRTVQQLRAH
jgi:hypothetical protein